MKEGYFRDVQFRNYVTLAIISNCFGWTLCYYLINNKFIFLAPVCDGVIWPRRPVQTWPLFWDHTLVWWSWSSETMMWKTQGWSCFALVFRIQDAHCRNWGKSWTKVCVCGVFTNCEWSVTVVHLQSFRVLRYRRRLLYSSFSFKLSSLTAQRVRPQLQSSRRVRSETAVCCSR